jgi:dTDP-4-dehydrorhamnose 3,5-epimerase
MKIIETKLSDIKIFEPKVFSDSRGFFLETWRKKNYEAAGVDLNFVQDNVSVSKKGVLRGLHYQYPHSQGKLVQVLAGEVFDVAVDIRLGSPTFGKWVSVQLSETNHRQLYVPAGFAHGFCVISGKAIFSYKCTDYYDPAAEAGIIWDDPDMNIDWPVGKPELSEKDGKYPKLADVPADRLPQFGKI